MAAGSVPRGRIILLLAHGCSLVQVAQLLPVQRTVVRKWASQPSPLYLALYPCALLYG